MSNWREQFKVHPATDVFPMMSDEELQTLGEDIKANGLKEFPTLQSGDDHVLVDGRNRMEAMERCGIAIPDFFKLNEGDPVAYIISKNVHRRHLTKQQQADLIVAAHKTTEDKPRQVGEVSKGGRGKADPVKAAAVATAKEHGIGKRTIERSFAKAEGRASKSRGGTKRSTPEVDQRHILQITFESADPRAQAWFCEIMSNCGCDPKSTIAAMKASLDGEANH